MKISVINILNSSNASLHNDGIKVYNEIRKNFESSQKEEVEVDFSDIKRCSTLFLNASFGKLLADFGEEEVRKYIHPVSYTQILNFMHKYTDMWDNFVNKENYQAYREEALA